MQSASHTVWTSSDARGSWLTAQKTSGKTLAMEFEININFLYCLIINEKSNKVEVKTESKYQY
jgi:hypothetical protein